MLANIAVLLLLLASRCSLYCSLPTCRADAKMHPTNWLEALPQSTLVSVMNVRCSSIGGAAASSVTRTDNTVQALSCEEIKQLEDKISKQMDSLLQVVRGSLLVNVFPAVS